MWLTLLYRFWYIPVILLLTASTAYYRHNAISEHDDRIRAEDAYRGLEASVEALGQAQAARNKEIAKQQEQVNRETVKSADARVNSILDRYRLLASKSGAMPGVRFGTGW